MKYQKIGKSGIDGSVVALGTWVMGGWMWGGASEKESIAAIHASIDKGINFIDTAPIYGFGRSEEIVGKGIKDRRDKVVLATKCGMRWDIEKGDFFFHSDEEGATKGESEKKIYLYQGPEGIREEIERSLKRLQTDYIDLYQTHWQESTTPIEDTMAELLKLKDEGKIRAIGASNATPSQMDEYRAKGQLDADQEKYNLLERKKEDEGNLGYCDKNDIAFLAYSPIAQGLLTGKFDENTEFKGKDVRKGNPMFSPEGIKKVNTMLKEWDPVKEKHNATYVQLAIAWTYERKGVSHVLVGARNQEQAEQNAVAGIIDLSPDDIAVIDSAYDKHFG